MTGKWLNERKKDYYYRKAKKENYRSRAAYKLIQMNERFHVFKEGYVVIDLGANPGGWSQVAAEFVGKSGRVIAIDIKPIEPIEGVITLKGDARSGQMLATVRELLQGKTANIIISDMAPNISGNYSFDHARSIELAEMALSYSETFLGPGGNMLVKVFDGDLAPELFERIRKMFRNARRYSPDASRKSSSEIYMVGKNKIN
jgi:23S rRNA (uridine2552-2'-O)-methyltransferase